MMTTFAVALQIYSITHSSAAVGGIGLAAAIPSLVVGLFGGPLIDSVDRRRLVLATSSCLALISAGFAVQAFAGNRSIWLLYGLVALQNAFSSISGPAQRTFLPRLLPTSLIPAGAALTLLSMHLSLVAGPTLAGLLTAAAGLRFCYLLDALSFLASLYAVLRLPAMRPEGPGSGRGPRAVAEGLRFVRGSRPVLGALLTDLSATALAMPIALFPALNAERFGGSPETLGLLTAALAAGGILGSALSGPVSHVHRHGRAMLVATVFWGLGLVGLGLVDGLAASLACLVVAGTADVLSVVFRTSLIQLATPDRYRGRVSAVEYVVGAGAPELGNFRAGVLGSLYGPGAAAAIGGVSCLAGTALITLTIPALSRFRTPREEVSRA